MNNQLQQQVQTKSPLDLMVDGREYESIISAQPFNCDVVKEIRKSLCEITEVRGNYVVCYMSNIIRGGNDISIGFNDELPFREMVNQVPQDKKNVDIILVTPGGLTEQVKSFVNILRPRFEKVSFILLDKAMSAGTMFIMSGDEIIMSKQSKFGPIDPQILNKEGRLIPAQSLLVEIEDIKKRGQEKLNEHKQPDWTDLQILKNIDPAMLGIAKTASQNSIDMVKEFLVKYKFRTWEKHSSTGNDVTEQERKERAEEIASLLCNHSEWKDHGHAITRDEAWDKCKIKIIHSESIVGLDRAMRRMWALLNYTFETINVSKIFISKDYCIIRNTKQNNTPKNNIK